VRASRAKKPRLPILLLTESEPVPMGARSPVDEAVFRSRPFAGASGLDNAAFGGAVRCLIELLMHVAFVIFVAAAAVSTLLLLAQAGATLSFSVEASSRLLQP
jgi:hypothetical protein